MSVPTPVWSRPDDAVRQAQLDAMKRRATGLLALAAAIFGAAAALETRYPWLGYVRATAEASLVGALADWFAVTALFKRPLGLPIPHTAILPTKKDVFGQALGDFVGENFLSAHVVRSRLRAVGIGARVGKWLAEPEHADRVTEQGMAVLRGTLRVLRDSDVQAVVSEAVTRRAQTQEIGPGLGKMLARVVEDG